MLKYFNLKKYLFSIVQYYFKVLIKFGTNFGHFSCKVGKKVKLGSILFSK
jgi:hypothetical protein